MFRGTRTCDTATSVGIPRITCLSPRKQNSLRGENCITCTGFHLTKVQNRGTMGSRRNAALQRCVSRARRLVKGKLTVSLFASRLLLLLYHFLALEASSLPSLLFAESDRGKDVCNGRGLSDLDPAGVHCWHHRRRDVDPACRYALAYPLRSLTREGEKALKILLGWTALDVPWYTSLDPFLPVQAQGLTG